MRRPFLVFAAQDSLLTRLRFFSVSAGYTVTWIMSQNILIHLYGKPVPPRCHIAQVQAVVPRSNGPSFSRPTRFRTSSEVRALTAISDASTTLRIDVLIYLYDGTTIRRPTCHCSLRSPHRRLPTTRNCRWSCVFDTTTQKPPPPVNFVNLPTSAPLS